MNALAERFTEKVSPEPMSGCWLWTAATTRGYGVIKTSKPRQMLKAHRVAWELFRGNIPDGLCLCHRCDVRCCVNPDHLFLGTNADNAADRNRKGRQAHGARNRSAKLTADDVRTIRATAIPGTYAHIGRLYGVGRATIRKIVTGENWRAA